MTKPKPFGLSLFAHTMNEPSIAQKSSLKALGAVEAAVMGRSSLDGFRIEGLPFQASFQVGYDYFAAH